MSDMLRIDLIVEDSPEGVDPITVVTNALAAHGCKIAEVDPDGYGMIAEAMGGPVEHWTPADLGLASGEAAANIMSNVRGTTPS